MDSPDLSSVPDSSEFTTDERNAMRAYLQRCEVRLSTLHRVGVSFVSGAGLLLLIPVFFKDVVDAILEILLRNADNHFTGFGQVGGWIMTALLYVALIYPFLLSLIIPIYGVYLLLKDVVHFYFTTYMPGFPLKLLTPTFTLGGLSFSPDESPRVKDEIMRQQYQPGKMQLMAPFSSERRHLYFDTLIENTHGDILPRSRDYQQLMEKGIVSPYMSEEDVKHFNAALGLARSLDRSLVEEVAITEMSLVRHVIYLRRLMLRYVKTLLMFIWTTMVSFLMLPFLKDANLAEYIYVVMAVGYLIWSLSVLYIIDMPRSWIYLFLHSEIEDKHVDTQLTQLEQLISPWCHVAVYASFLALALGIFAF